MKKLFLTLMLAAALMLSQFSSLYAVGEDMESLFFIGTPMVVSSTLEEVEIDKNPASMTVITSKDIEANGYDTLYDALRSVVGLDFYVDENEERLPIIRGYHSTSGFPVLFLLDGHRLNDRITGMHSMWDLIDLNNVKQIEVIRGPGSALYGSGAFSGVINIITKKDPGGAAKVGYGEWNSLRGNVSYLSQKKDNGIQYGGSIQFLDEKGPQITQEQDAISVYPFSLTYAEPYKREEGRPAKRYHGTAKIAYKDLDLTCHYLTYSGMWRPGYGFMLSEEGYFTDHLWRGLLLNYSTKLTDIVSLKYKLDYSLNTIKYHTESTPDGFTLGMDLNGDSIVESWSDGLKMIGMADNQKIINDILLHFDIDKHSIHTGISYAMKNLDNITHETNATFLRVPGAAYGRPVYRPMSFIEEENLKWLSKPIEWQTVFSLLVQDMYTIQEDLTATLGVRYDQYSEIENANSTNPRLDIVWKKSDDLILKGGYSTAYTIPHYGYRIYDNIGSYVGNPDLKPEKISSFEASVGNSFAKEIHYSLTLFSNSIKDAITFVPLASSLGGGVIYDNVVEVTNQGAELEGSWQVKPYLKLWGNYAYLDSKNKDTEKPFRDTAQNKGNLGAIWSINDQMSWSTSLFITTERQRSADFPNNGKNLEGYSLVNTNFIYKQDQNLRYSLSIYNLLDAKYYMASDNYDSNTGLYASDMEQDPRQVRIAVNYSF